MEEDIGFDWWTASGWLILILGNLSILGFVGELMAGGANPQKVWFIAFIFIIPTTALGAYILKFNKYAFLIATIISINPLVWIINGIYLKNRWYHPKTNKGIDLRPKQSPRGEE